MVVRYAETPAKPLPQYPFVTNWLYIPRFLGLNMNVPHKPLIDSGLAAFLIFDSNKTAPKGVKNAPIFGRGRSK